MRSRFSERRIIISLIGFLAIEVGLLLAHLGVLTFDSQSHESGEAVAGYIGKSQNQLRRRGMNSLVWEKSQTDEAVYFHDSVLTLSQSTATLHLQQTEVTLSENTLVTIEPQEKREHGEIRLKFVKGNLQARNPYQATRIDGNEWTVDVHQGSEVEFRQVGTNDFELQVTKGEAVFKSDSGENKVTSAEMLRIDGTSSEKVAVDTALTWEGSLPQRVYAHADKIEMPLHYKGKASQLVVQSLGQPEKELSAPEADSKMELPVGQHRLFLREAGKTSAPLNVQVWRAPVIHLLRPLPRDRIGLGETVQFVWTQVPGVTHFRVVTKGARSSGENQVEGNFSSAKFDEPDDVEWSVYGRDADGYEIPPLYSNPLYIRENPLAPPKLKTPSLRRPAADEGASYWWRVDQWILPQAHAAETISEAIFAWEPVEGADQYVIEISDSADFRKPLVMKTVSKSQFVWRGFPPAAYFWRVAAGTKRGRMGVFSEAAQVDLANAEASAASGVAIRTVEPKKASAKVEEPVREPKPEPVAKSEPVAPVAPQSELKLEDNKSEKIPAFGHFVAWSPRYMMARLKTKDKATANLSGATMMGVFAETPIPIAENRLWRLGFNYAQSEFKPNPESKYPYQANLKWQDMRVSALYFQKWWGYGAVVHQAFSVKRESEESLKKDSSFGAGPALAILLRGKNVLYSGDAAVLATQGGVAVETAHSLRFNLYRGFTLGAGVDAGVTSSSSVEASAFGLAGFEF